MVVRMRHTRSHTGNRRSHHALAPSELSVCQNCKQEVLPHRACGKCGMYRGRQVRNVQAKIDKKLRKQKEKEKQAR